MTQPLDTATRQFMEKHISKWMLDDGNHKLLWKDKAPTPNEVLDLLASQKQELIKRFEEMIGEDELEGWGLDSNHGCSRNALKADLRSKLRELKEPNGK